MMARSPTPKSAARSPAPAARRHAPPGTAARRILIASHAHPRISKGGAEIAAHTLFSALGSRPQYAAWFLGCVRDPVSHKLGSTISQPYSEREYLYAGGAFDWFKFANTDANFPGAFRALLRELAPDIAHFHHYINFGVEAFLHIRETLPNCKIVLTLHEYLAICHHFGQMVTRRHRTLCHEATPLRCCGCFADITPSDFFLRTLYIRRFLDLVDHFIAPSQFLAGRYVAWGIPEAKISVIDNVIEETRAPPPAARREGPLRVGFFGQVSVLKGIGVLLDAAELLEQRQDYGVVFDIHGDYSGQPAEFQQHFLARMDKAGRNVMFRGPYDQSRVDALMQSVDIVLTPSIWWENSPVVIEEALRNRRPIVCSGIGGMAEKVRDGVDGFHFPVGDAVGLAALLSRLAAAPKQLQAIGRSARSPAPAEDVISGHDRLYASLLS
jgi:glycosyltransferase involved in cell wall biosynthesis